MDKDAERYDRVIRLLAHDVRNPLTAVQLNAQIIEHAAARDGREKDQRMASRIASAARRLDSMLQQLVEAERIRSGHIPLVREPVALDQLLRELLTKESPGFDLTRIDFTLPKEPVVVSADRARVGQALVNLLCLALQHAGSASVVKIDVQASDGEVSCTLHAPGRQEVEAWRPAAASETGETSRTQPSDGMALHLARTLVECHGGRLQVEDGDHDTNFEIVLPFGRV
jgi:signal transduction histidine kinase